MSRVSELDDLIRHTPLGSNARHLGSPKLYTDNHPSIGYAISHPILLRACSIHKSTDQQNYRKGSGETNLANYLYRLPALVSTRTADRATSFHA